MLLKTRLISFFVIAIGFSGCSGYGPREPTVLDYAGKLAVPFYDQLTGIQPPETIFGDYSNYSPPSGGGPSQPVCERQMTLDGILKEAGVPKEKVLCAVGLLTDMENKRGCTITAPGMGPEVTKEEVRKISETCGER